MYKHIRVPTQGEKITVNKDFSLKVPAQPILPYIEGDGTGVDITPVMKKVVDAAVQWAYGGKRKLSWIEMYAGEKSCRVYGENVWLPGHRFLDVASVLVEDLFPSGNDLRQDRESVTRGRLRKNWSVAALFCALLIKTPFRNCHRRGFAPILLRGG